MLRRSTVLLLMFLAVFTLFVFEKHSRATKSNPRPLRRTELIALVAGESQPESIAYEMRVHGVCSPPTEHFKSLLSNAGAEPKVLSALNEAKVVACVPDDISDDAKVLERMSRAGGQIRAKQFVEATAELNSALDAKDANSATGFVMGMFSSASNASRRPRKSMPTSKRETPTFRKFTPASAGCISTSAISMTL
jgi:hypothetical protein